MDLVLGLPLHVLLVHAVVAIGPLAALFALGYALLPKFRVQLLWPTAALAVITGITGFLAVPSGSALEGRLRAGASPAEMDMIHEHMEAGDLARVACLLFMVAVLAMVFYFLRAPRPGDPPPPPRFGRGAGMAVTALVVVLSLATVGAVINAGHSGSNAAWRDRVAGTG